MPPELRARISTAGFLLVGILLLFSYGYAYAAWVGFGIAYFALKEWCILLEYGAKETGIVLIGGAAGLIIAKAYPDILLESYLLAAWIFWLVCLKILEKEWLKHPSASRTLINWAILPGMATFILFYRAWLTLFAGPYLVPVLALALVALSDTGGYFVGKALGRTPLTRVASPKKTLEGVLGGVVCAGGFSAVYVHLLLGWSPWLGLVLGVVTAVAAVLGDLVESMWKRWMNKKDSGTLLPGHGGILDRLDGYLLGLPIFSFMLEYLSLRSF